MADPQQTDLEYLIIAHWGLQGSSSSTQAGYRSQNPWQALEHYMEGTRGDSATFLDSHGATTTRIDSGGSVWRIELESRPTPEGLSIDEFSRVLLDRLIEQIPQPVSGDYVCVSYAEQGAIGRWDWTHA